MSLTIKHKRVLGAKGLKGLYKIPNRRAVVREAASSGRSTGCQEKLNLACMLPLPGSWQASLCLCPSLCTVLPPPSIGVQAPHLGAGGQLGSTCTSCLNARASVLLVCRIPPVGSSLRGGKISSRCCCPSGRVLFIMAIL